MGNATFEGLINLDAVEITLPGFAAWSAEIETRLSGIETALANITVTGGETDLTAVMAAIADCKAAVESGRVIPELTVDPND